MKRTKAMVAVALLLLIAAAVVTFALLPKHYAVGQSMPQAWAFWSRDEAFVFLMLHTTGRSRNVVQERLAATQYGYLTALLGGYIDFAKQDVAAYHLGADGKLERFPLPEGTVLSGTWSLENGRLQLAPPGGAGRGMQGFRWDGSRFAPVVPSPVRQTVTPSQDSSTTLGADDSDDDGGDYGLMNETARQQLKAAGWHYRFLTSFRAGEAMLPMKVNGNSYVLTLENSSLNQRDLANFDFTSYGVKDVKLSGDRLANGGQSLWSRSGWQTVSKQDYEKLRGKYAAPGYAGRFVWGWLILALVLVGWKFWSWFHLLFAFGSVKRRVLQNMSTSISFPPATTSQFPLLDLNALEQYTRELEGLGFTRLLDCSPISDSPTYPTGFCRLFAHTRHHCFTVVSQFFLRGKKPLPAKCSVESFLQGGWSLAFTDRKPQAAGSLLRRRQALGVSMPEAHTSELLQAMLKMRDQVCVDLGIAPLNDDSLEAYISKTQRATAEMREAVQEKNFVKGLSEVYVRRFSLLRTKPEYVWLGDYPREAERRKQGVGNFSTGAHL